MVGEEKKEEANALFDQVADVSHVQEVEEEVMEAYAKRPRAPLAVTKETILATIDSGDADYLRANRLTKKKSINLQHTRQLHGAFSTVERNVAGKKRLVSATVLARAIYRFAAAPTTEAATAQYAIVRVLLTYCGVMGSSEKEGLLHFITVDGWRMARKTPEARDDPSPHSPLKRRVLLAKLLLEADPTWLVEKASIIEALQAFIVCQLPQVRVLWPAARRAKRMALLTSEDALELRAYVENVGSKVAAEMVGQKVFAPPPPA